nr:hypothetical protein [Tanacetum cinerariifolium]
MRNKEAATWVWGKRTWEGRERSFGTISVLAELVPELWNLDKLSFNVHGGGRLAFWSATRHDNNINRIIDSFILNNMVKKDLDLEPKIDAMMSLFRRKELKKKTSSKILPCADGSCWKTF